ncbi:peptidoglycan/LPS O-acetylase OafA/YrhL [Paraburkholderia sp. BL27I4N3]|uniref:acyltransferase family protein n=1 Tax=Paraburkholderia sp. BL27I4N3 TaxID=1938805 RepID=UPI000E2706E2|nr:acyltransferase [Paraburkholderia sp. BL27I4N3]REE19879.1 peptidoglycan/LPS O-acetylase OafA/YrhL [Paraburkholderia sp. BL27I4N3]
MSHIQHTRIAGLDGLRALSVIAVFLAHTGLAGVVGGGYVGVDVFFVLSGYLITSRLIAEHHRNGRIDLPRFYWRRARRLYPALLLMLAGVALYCLVFPGSLRVEFEVLPAFFYVMNWVRAFGIYDAHLTGHTWTLAIEEQFYLVWPLILLGVLKFWPRRLVLAVALLAVAVIAWRSFLMSQHLSMARIYCGFDTHSDGLLMGALLAVMPRQWTARAGKLWPLAVAILLIVTLSENALDFSLLAWGYPLTPLAAALIIAKVVTAQQAALVRSLDIAPLAGLGRVSYGFYLWHYVVLQSMLYGGHERMGAFFGRFSHPNIAMVTITFVISMALTLVSWFAVEKPAMRLRFPWRRSAAMA